MPQVDVYDIQKNKVKEISLSDYIFASEVKEHIINKVVHWQMANRRRGTAKKKERAEVNFSTKKLWRQKGTGRARVGSARSPIRVGGGTVFGPKLRSFQYALPKKVRKAALRSALSLKCKEGKLLVLDSFELTEIKTKGFCEVTKRFDAPNVLIIEENNMNLILSSRNVPYTKVLTPNGLNVYDLLRYDKVLIVEPSLKKIEDRLSA
ncbi:MAG: 50S ribosomal protein L4 [Thermodesulfobacteriota bacterium]|nr:50S ribosomal protein L4 [Thermodesulfobacteriota bacterium]